MIERGTTKAIHALNHETVDKRTSRQVSHNKNTIKQKGIPITSSSKWPSNRRMERKRKIYNRRYGPINHSFAPDQLIYARQYQNQGEKWETAKIVHRIERVGRVSYKVEISSRCHIWHANQLRSRTASHKDTLNTLLKTYNLPEDDTIKPGVKIKYQLSRIWQSRQSARIWRPPRRIDPEPRKAHGNCSILEHDLCNYRCLQVDLSICMRSYIIVDYCCVDVVLYCILCVAINVLITTCSTVFSVVVKWMSTIDGVIEKEI